MRLVFVGILFFHIFSSVIMVDDEFYSSHITLLLLKSSICLLKLFLYKTEIKIYTLAKLSSKILHVYFTMSFI